MYPGGGSGSGSAVPHELSKMSSECMGEGDAVRAADSLSLFARRCSPSSWNAAGERFCSRSLSVVVYLLFFLPRRPSGYPGWNLRVGNRMSGLGPNLQTGLEGVQDRQRGNHLFFRFSPTPPYSHLVQSDQPVSFWCGRFKIFSLGGGKKKKSCWESHWVQALTSSGSVAYYF